MCNCLKLNVKPSPAAQQMVQGKTFSINEINKKGNKHLSININRSTHSLIVDRQKHIENLCQGKQGNDPVITAKGKTGTLERANLNKKLHFILRETSKAVKKDLKTYSFRIEITTTVIEVAGIEVAQKIIVYSNLTTTAFYNSTQYKENLYLRLMKKVERFRREKGLPRQYRKRKREEEQQAEKL